MSETTDAAPPEAETDANFSATRTTANRAGKNVPALTFTFGTPKRIIVAADLSLGDQFNLVELAGD